MSATYTFAGNLSYRHQATSRECGFNGTIAIGSLISDCVCIQRSKPAVTSPTTTAQAHFFNSKIAVLALSALFIYGCATQVTPKVAKQTNQFHNKTLHFNSK